MSTKDPIPRPAGIEAASLSGTPDSVNIKVPSSPQILIHAFSFNEHILLHEHVLEVRGSLVLSAYALAGQRAYMAVKPEVSGDLGRSRRN